MLLRLAAVVAAATLSVSVRAGEPAPRVVVAKTQAPVGTFFARPANGNQYRPLPENDALFVGDLLVSLPGGVIVSKNDAVTLKALSDFDGNSPLPVFETAVSLNDPKDSDCDFVLDRGRVDLTNNKASGAATVRVHFWDQCWTIVLDEPESRVALELYGRWPSGTRFRQAEPGADFSKLPVPVASLVLLVLKGSATVNEGGVTLGLKAPPGPAELQWNSLTGARPQPLRLDALPKWADPGETLGERGKKVAAAVAKYREARLADPTKANEEFLASDNAAEQRVALVMLGALDEIQKMGKALSEAKTPEEWDFGITVIRHWLGRARGQDQRLFQALVDVRGYTPNQAKIVMGLLFGFSATDIQQPETFEVLIDYLLHEKPGIRNLAAWHLVRLVPQGKTLIAFKPNATPAENEKAYEAWKKLIPRGTLPQNLTRKQ